MADKTGIEWTEATWNPIAGCDIVSPGCAECYAMKRVAPRLANNPATKHYQGTVKRAANGDYVWTGKIGIARKAVFDKPKTWTRGRDIFVNSTSDLFHPDVPDYVIDKIWDIMEETPQHRYQILTKREQRMSLWTQRSTYRMLPNVCLGVSVENQEWADRRRKYFADTIAAVRFVSYEPALGPVDWSGWQFIDWMIAGGESSIRKIGARPAHPDWFRETRDWCRVQSIPFMFKQWGDWISFTIDNDGKFHPPQEISGDMNRWRRWDGEKFRPTYKGETVKEFLAPGMLVAPVGKKKAGRLLDGQEWNQMPERRAA